MKINNKTMKRIIGILLLVLALYLGYVGLTSFANSSESVEILGLELSAEDSQQKTTSFVYMGFALLSFIGGIFLVKDKN